MVLRTTLRNRSRILGLFRPAIVACMRFARGMAFGVGIFVCSATATIIVLAFRTTRMNTPSGVLLFILVLLAGTLLMVPIAIWYRRQMELARTKIVPIPNSADKLRLLAYDTVGASKLFRNLASQILFGHELASPTRGQKGHAGGPCSLLSIPLLVARLISGRAGCRSSFRDRVTGIQFQV